MEEKISALEHQLLEGGEKIQESPEFHAAVQEVMTSLMQRRSRSRRSRRGDGVSVRLCVCV